MQFSIDTTPEIIARIPATLVEPGDTVEMGLMGASHPRIVSWVEREPEYGHLVVSFSDSLGVARWHPSMTIKVIQFHDDGGNDAEGCV